MRQKSTIITLTLNPAVDKSSALERVLADHKLYCQEPVFEPGGGGLNVSRAIHKLGGNSQAHVAIGGPTGEMVQLFMKKEGLRYRIQPIKGWTRENLTILEKQTGLQFRFGMPGPPLRRSEWQSCLEGITRLIPRPDYVVASGSLPAGVPDDFYARLCFGFKKSKTRIVLDPSGKPLKRALGSGVYLIKMNLRELSGLVGHSFKNESQYQRAAKGLLQRKAAEVLVISLGAGGVMMMTANQCKSYRSPVVPVQSRIGAGDSLVAGMVLGLARGYALEDAVMFGVASGTAAVMSPGTELCGKKDTERLFRQIKKETYRTPCNSSLLR